RICADDGTELMSIIYGDAQQFIGVETTVTFEAAARQTIRFGTPSIQSVGFVLMEIYERIGHLFYNQSFIDDPARDDYSFDIHGLDESMGLWEEEALNQSIRTDANIVVDHGIGKFFDPVDYLRYVQSYVSWKVDQKTVKPPPADEGPDTPLPGPTPANLIPR